ncbi:MAG: hypothetical protein Q8S22_09095 [Eubacteriales bacterium]|jgi:hypothetical protein|nr:hypothetical protein [Eubacteriales bacterium]
MITNDLQNRIHFGDREAFLAVYQEYGHGVYAAAHKALSSDSLAKSAVKQTFLTLYEEILARTEDFDIPVRIREITEREIRLLRLVSGAPESTGVPDDAVPDPEAFSARGAFAKDAALLSGLPSLERERSFRRPRKALFVRKRKSRSAGSQVGVFWKVLLVLIDLFLLWILAGMLMALGVLPVVDLGYTWFSNTLSSIALHLS